jgi:diaminohydroxyphosphoribosylaminopyrimidine deaminase/5-amino-6-(5-phosphoribosylamino)uracil reductase
LIFTSVNSEPSGNVEFKIIDFDRPVIPQILQELYERGISSVMVEGGEHLLNSFIDSGMWDSARVFISEKTIGKGVPAPVMQVRASVKENVSGDKLLFYQNSAHLSLK